jgi:hypothetical protein
LGFNLTEANSRSVTLSPVGFVEFGTNLQPLSRGGIGDEVDGDFVADEQLAAPVLSDVAKYPMLDLVPFDCAWWKLTNVGRHPKSVGQLLKCHLPEAAATAVASAAVGHDQQISGIAMPPRTHLLSPTTDRFSCETSRIVVDSNADPALVLREVVDTVGNGLPELFVHKVMDEDLLEFATRLPFPPAILEVSDEFLLLRIDGNHGLATLLKTQNNGVDVLEVGIAVGVARAFSGLAVAPQTVPARLKADAPWCEGSLDVPPGPARAPIASCSCRSSAAAIVDRRALPDRPTVPKRPPTRGRSP